MGSREGISNRVAVISGVRTPFVKAGSKLGAFSLQQLGAHTLKALVQRNKLDPATIDLVSFSTVLLDPRTPNWAREIVFMADFPKTVYAHSVSNNCISGLVSMSNVAEKIALGLANIGIAGGTESMSNPPLLFHPKAAEIFLKLNGARSLGQKLQLAGRFRPKHFVPVPPGAKEPSTGLTMGEHMELTAQELGISRKDEDALAYESHQNASRATEDGRLTLEIEPLNGIAKDLLIRPDTSLEKLATLKPAFDKTSGKGTLTAGNSTSFTDGASAVLLMSEGTAKEQDREVLAYIRGYEFCAIDPNDGLLMAPVLCVPKLLKRLGLGFGDFDLIEIHEAFAAQVLANMHAWEHGWKAQPPFGVIDRSKLNTLGGSLAIGHPFAATGGRIVTTLANEMKRRNLKRGLISICAAGAMAGAMVLERD